ncbi:hypothetical protein FRC08_009104 [Ceratobasidium sp. 394]|nr:hypothetical protein FRC08_009104 [Ceratobasidium sp. 394]
MIENFDVPLVTNFQEAVRSVLFSLYRVNNFNNIADKHYPHVPVDHEEWPHSLKNDGTRENHMRLDFEQYFDSPADWPQIQRWSVAGVQPYLDSISEDDLLDRIEKTFGWEKRTYRDAMKNTPIPTKNRTESGAIIPPALIVEPNPAPLTEEEIAIKSVKLATMPTSTRQSHQETVSQCQT